MAKAVRTGYPPVASRIRFSGQVIRKIRVYFADRLNWPEADNAAAELALTVPLTGLEFKRMGRAEPRRR